MLFLMNSAVLKDPTTKRLKVQGCVLMDNKEYLSKRALQLSILTNIRLLIIGFSTLTRGSVIPVYSARSHDD